MSTISELVAAHSKVPGDIKVTHEPGSKIWFQPFFKEAEFDWVGPSSMRPNDTWSDHFGFSLYTEPKPKVKRWLWACAAVDDCGKDWSQDEWFLTEEEAAAYFGDEPYIKLPFTETEFKE